MSVTGRNFLVSLVRSLFLNTCDQRSLIPPVFYFLISGPGRARKGHAIRSFRPKPLIDGSVNVRGWRIGNLEAAGTWLPDLLPGQPAWMCRAGAKASDPPPSTKPVRARFPTAATAHLTPRSADRCGWCVHARPRVASPATTSRKLRQGIKVWCGTVLRRCVDVGRDDRFGDCSPA